MICPNPDCTAEEPETFEVQTRYGMFGTGLWADCPDCGHSFEIEVLVLEPRRRLPSFPPKATTA